MMVKRVAQLFLPLCVLLLLGFAAISPAHAAPGYVNVDLSVSGDGEVSIDGGSYGTYAYDTVGYNDTVNITAIPDPYWRFKGWWDNNSGSYVSYDYDIWFTATEDISYTAVFEEEYYTLLVELMPIEGGKVYCGAVTDAWVDSIYYPLVAGYYAIDVYENSDYNFMGWYDELGNFVSADVPYYFFLSDDMELHAEFQKVPDPLYFVYLDIDDYSGGWVYGHLSSNNYGESITIEAVPASGYIFAGWTETYTGMPVSPDAKYTFKIYDDQYYTAHFKAADAPCTIVTLPGEGSGIMPDYTVTTGDTFYLPECTFTPPPGKVFDCWNVGDPGDGIVVNSDMTITAEWKEAETHLVYIDPNGGTGYMPDPYIEHGTEYTLPECEFDPPAGMEFAGWDVGKPGEKITVNSDMSIYAQWQPEGTAAASSGSSSSASTDPSGSSASASASSESVSASAASASASAASSGASGSGSSASGSSTGSGNNQGGNDLPILPIVGGLAGGAAVGGLVAFLASRRKKDKKEESARAAAAEPIEKPVGKHASHEAEDEGFED